MDNEMERSRFGCALHEKYLMVDLGKLLLVGSAYVRVNQRQGSCFFAPQLPSAASSFTQFLLCS